LSFSLAFFVSNVLLSLSQHSGELLIRFVSGDYVQVGLFGAAYRSYYTVTIAIWQFTMAFSPLFTTLRTQNEPQELRRWAEFLLKWTAVGGVILVFLILLLGENLVPFVFGKSYLQAAANLLPLMVALLVYALGCVARVLALTYDRPGIPLVAWRGSFAGCLAVLFATTIYAAFFTWRIRGAIGYSLRGWLMAILSGTLFLPLAWLRSSWRVNLALFAGFLIVYAAVLLVLRIVTPDEIARVRLALKPRVLTQEI
jgi:O-antigen/teichoic acid export membrane protein